MSDAENTLDARLSGEPPVEQATAPAVPAPSATGNDKITVLQHSLPGITMERDEEFPTARINLAIRNVSSLTIATAVFEAVFYGKAGEIVDTVKHSEVELTPETSRMIHITSSIPVYEFDKIQSYAVRLLRANSADMEKVQFQRYELSTTETGEEQVTGIVKNISQVKTDVAVAATFYDSKKETIATKILALRDMEPSKIRKFVLSFKPQDGDTVRSCSLVVGELVE